MKHPTKMHVCGMMMSALLPLSAADPILNEAVSQDKSLGEISERLKDINTRQVESRVFDDAEIGKVKDDTGVVENVRGENVRRIVESLSENGSSSEKDRYKVAEDEYNKAIKRLEDVMKTGEKLRNSMEAGEILAKQKEILEETRKADSERKSADKKMSHEDLDKIAELAERQEELEENAEKSISEETRRKMDEAARSLQDLDPRKALEKQEEVVKSLEKEVAENQQNQQLEDLDRAQDLEQMQKDLREIASELDDSINKKDQISDQERQDMAMKMDELARKLKEEEAAKNADKDLNKAIENTMEGKDLQAYSEVQRALQKVDTAAKEARKQLADAKRSKQAETSEKAQKDSKGDDLDGQEKAIGQTRKDANTKDGDWAAKLPEKERSALMSARKAKYDDKLDESVRKYFTEIAK